MPRLTAFHWSLRPPGHSSSRSTRRRASWWQSIHRRRTLRIQSPDDSAILGTHASMSWPTPARTRPRRGLMLSDMSSKIAATRGWGSAEKTEISALRPLSKTSKSCLSDSWRGTGLDRRPSCTDRSYGRRNETWPARPGGPAKARPTRTRRSGPARVSAYLPCLSSSRDPSTAVVTRLAGEILVETGVRSGVAQAPGGGSR